MTKVCQVSGKKPNNGYSVSHSHIRNKKVQSINLHKKKVWSVKDNCWIRMRISTKALKSLYKMKL